MITDFVNDDGSTRKVWIRMTADERRQLRNAHLAAWLIFWRTPADLMGPDLENIVCGHRPERYVTLEDWPNTTAHRT